MAYLFTLSCVSAALGNTEVVASPAAVLTKIESVDIPNASIVYYDIAGSTEYELRDELNSLAPIGYDGYKGDASTEWYIHWNWPGHGSDSCDLSAAVISHDIKVIFPRWKPSKDVSPDLIAKWSNYIVQLALHESGHVDYVVEKFPSVVNAIKGATCDSADAVATSILDQIRQHDIDYDAETQHGATQAAIFP